MAILVHHITGVKMNEISIHRTSLDKDEIETARLLEAEGMHRHSVAAMLGINMGRITEALGPHPDPTKGGQMDMFGP
ncbi:MAG: hypothetical protein Q7V20_23060 [Aquabacterium sp.]|uniref:hypothetical protein n=1 Tax=Aquabacterium sp. TaxID=1872578 RepID=UPI0027277869|nr:hypothetical protein [Aquabacterium sp.]MDO9006334.1 hypothetical protein [Aquabacterium sp.]